MTFSESISTCLQKYATFTGRASRSEYWWFYLFTFIVGCAVSGPSVFLTIRDVMNGLEPGSHQSMLGTLVGLALALPSIAVGIRRLHDTGRSGWWYLIGLIPIVGTIILIVFYCQPTMPYDNRYGYPPAR